MIHRSQITVSTDGARHIADRVKAGESVRISGLGVLAAHHDTKRGNACPDAVACDAAKLCTYRLTLISTLVRNGGAQWGKNHGDGAAMARDVRHLARALGAPVEVWAPGEGRAANPWSGRQEKQPCRFITTVAP